MLIFSQNKDYLIDSNVFPLFELVRSSYSDGSYTVWANSNSHNLQNVCLGKYLDEKTAIRELELLAEALAEGTETIFRFS